MFGPLSRAGRAATRHTRRRNVFIGIGVLVLCLIIGETIDQVVNAQGSVDHRTDATFIAAMVPIVAQSNSLEPLLAQIRNAPSDLSNVTVPRSVLAQWLEELQSGANLVNSSYVHLGLLAPSTKSSDMIGSALSDRLAIANDVSSGVSAATTGNIGAADLLFRRTSALLRSSDHDYAAFLASLPRSTDGTKLPSSKWSNSGNWSTTATNNWTRAFSDSHILAAKQGVKIVAIALDPAAVAISGLASPTTTTTSTTTTSSTTTTTTTTTIPTYVSGVSGVSGYIPPIKFVTTTTTTIPVTSTTNQIPPLSTTSDLPATSTVAVTVVIANTGNVGLDDVMVSATVIPTANSATNAKVSRSSVQATVDHLGASGTRYLTIGKLHVVSGTSYRLVVSAMPKLGTSAQDTIKLKIG